MLFGCDGQHADEGGDVAAELARVEQRRVAGDDAALLELLDALDHRGRRQPDALADLGQRHFAVLLQQGEDLQIDGVEIQLFIFDFHRGFADLAKLQRQINPFAE